MDECGAQEYNANIPFSLKHIKNICKVYVQVIYYLNLYCLIRQIIDLSMDDFKVPVK